MPTFFANPQSEERLLGSNCRRNAIASGTIASTGTQVEPVNSTEVIVRSLRNSKTRNKDLLELFEAFEAL